MKRLIVLALAAPGTASAHGGHVELAEPAHSAFHLTPLLAAVAVVIAILAIWRARE